MVLQVEERLLTQELYKAVGGRMSWEAVKEGGRKAAWPQAGRKVSRLRTKF